jgi:hypothetical protein
MQVVMRLARRTMMLMTQFRSLNLFQVEPIPTAACQEEASLFKELLKAVLASNGGMRRSSILQRNTAVIWLPINAVTRVATTVETTVYHVLSTAERLPFGVSLFSTRVTKIKRPVTVKLRSTAPRDKRITYRRDTFRGGGESLDVS